MSDYPTSVMRHAGSAPGGGAPHADDVPAAEAAGVQAAETAPRRRPALGGPRLPATPSTAVWAGLVVTALGFAVIFFSWIKVAGTLDVALQLPYIASGAMTGIGLIIVGVAVIDMSVRRQDRLERRHQLTLMRSLLEEMAGRLDDDRPRDPR